jgi:uncharacterized protein YcnI
MRTARLLGLVLSLVAAAPAVAHVEVLPSEVTIGEAQRFTIRVPTEGNVATTSVRVTFPADVVVYSFAAPPPGWAVRPVESGGTITAAEYRGTPVGPNRFIEFEFLGNPQTAGKTVWPALQRLADGSVRRWTGPPESKEPAAIVTIRTADEPTSTQPAGANTSPSRTSSSAGIWLGVTAVAFSALAALVTGLLWSSRPAKLPEDEPGT